MLVLFYLECAKDDDDILREDFLFSWSNTCS